MFDDFFVTVGEAYENYPIAMWTMNNMLESAETYGTAKARMIDLGSFLYSRNIANVIPLDLRARMLEALNSCIIYVVRGTERSGATGLSFCSAFNLDAEDMVNK